jgi:hypothetical protein
MDKGIKLQKERAMGIKSADREALGKVGAPAKNPKAGKGMMCGGAVKKGKK